MDLALTILAVEAPYAVHLATIFVVNPLRVPMLETVMTEMCLGIVQALL